MIKELKKKSLKKNLPLIIILAIVAVFFVGVCFDGVLVLLGGKQDLDTMTADQIEPGMYVEATIYGIFDNYAYTEEKKDGSLAKVVSREYVIPVGEGEYMGLFAPKKYVSDCDALMEESWNYLDGVADEITGQIRVKGTVLEMDEESKAYYMTYLKDYADYENLSAEEQAAFLPYYLKIDFIGKTAASGFIAFMIFAGILILLDLIMIIRALSGGYQKMLIKYCKENGAEEKVDYFYRNTVPVEDMRISREFIMGMQQVSTLFFKADDLLWAYMEVTTHRRNFITVGKSYGVVLRTKDGHKYEHAVSNEQAAQNVLAEINRVLPHVIIGYSAELEKAYKKDRASLISLVESHKAELENSFETGF